jgi:hypothetical protein
MENTKDFDIGVHNIIIGRRGSNSFCEGYKYEKDKDYFIVARVLGDNFGSDMGYIVLHNENAVADRYDCSHFEIEKDGVVPVLGLKEDSLPKALYSGDKLCFIGGMVIDNNSEVYVIAKIKSDQFKLGWGYLIAKKIKVDEDFKFIESEFYHQPATVDVANITLINNQKKMSDIPVISVPYEIK